MKLLSTSQAAAAVGVSKRTLLDEMKRGKLRSKRIGTHYRTTSEWLDAWISSPSDVVTTVRTTINTPIKTTITINNILKEYYESQKNC